MPDLQSIELEAPIAHSTEGIQPALLDESADQTARFESAVVMVGRGVCEVSDLSRLVEDAAVLVARAVNIDHFGYARLRDEGQTTAFRFGKTELWGDKTKLIDHQLSHHPKKSATAFANASRQPLVIRDLESEIRFEDAVLTRHGLRSAIVCPMVFKNYSFGTVGVYGGKPREFSRAEVELVGGIALQLAAALARDKTELALAEQTRLMTSVMDYTASLWLMLADDCRIERCNSACEQLTGFCIDEIKDRHMWSAFLIPEDVAQVKKAFQSLRTGEKSATVETFLLTKHGDRKRVAWTFSALRDREGSLESFIGTGVDVTETFQTLEDFQWSQSAAEETKQALLEIKTRIESGELVEASSLGASRPGQQSIPAGLKKDRRTSRRSTFLYNQIIAPLKDGVLPPLQDYTEVLCRDISSSGFSYYSDESPPARSQFVVAFGVPPQQTFLTAEVVHSLAVHHEGRESYVVGCRYTGRVNY